MTVSINNVAGFRPMLSASLPCSKGKEGAPTAEEVMADLGRLNWSNGIWASPKIDGIRAVKHPTLGLVTRTLNQVPNFHIQDALKPDWWDFLDGELTLGSPFKLTPYNDTQSAVMSEGGKPVFTYWVFDHVENPNAPFRSRNAMAHDDIMRVKTKLSEIVYEGEHHGAGFWIKYLEQAQCQNVDELLRYEEECITRGYEGVIIRDPNGQYKNGRSTFKQQGMIKLKRFEDGEAKIVGFVEKQLNRNEPTRDALGYQKRSAHLAGRVAANTLGCFEVVGVGGPFDGVEFEVGSGLDDALRDTVWDARESYLGRLLKYKFQPHGVKDLPRAPIFLGFRDGRDL